VNLWSQVDQLGQEHLQLQIQQVKLPFQDQSLILRLFIKYQVLWKVLVRQGQELLVLMDLFLRHWIDQFLRL